MKVYEHVPTDHFQLPVITTVLTTVQYIEQQYLNKRSRQMVAHH